MQSLSSPNNFFIQRFWWCYPINWYLPTWANSACKNENRHNSWQNQTHWSGGKLVWAIYRSYSFEILFLSDNNLDLQNPSSFMHQLQYSNTIELSKVKMPELHPILEETIHQLNKTSNTSELIKRQSSSIRANYDNLTLEVLFHLSHINFLSKAF